MDRLGVFDFESRTWSTLMLKGSLPTWTFGHATKRGSYLWAFGCVARIGEEAAIEVKSSQMGKDCVCWGGTHLERWVTHTGSDEANTLTNH